MKRIVILATLALLAACAPKPERLQTGDLIFVGIPADYDLDATSMDSAITDTARKMTEQNMGSNSLAMQMYEQMKRSAGALTLEEIMEKQKTSEIS